MLQLLTVLQRASTALFQVCQQKPEHLDGSVSCDSFDNLELNAEFRHLGIGSLRYRESVEAPPTKRQKLSIELDLLGEITSNLCSLLGAQKATDLDGLHKVAE